jgi:hypothetical protein
MGISLKDTSMGVKELVSSPWPTRLRPDYSVSAVQRQMIERAVRLSLQLELMDERLTHGVTFKTRDHNHYLAWSNALTRTLARLDLDKAAQEPKPPPPTESFRSPVTNESAAEAYFRLLRARPNDAA